jgi:Na+/H+ antiporter NhaA
MGGAAGALVVANSPAAPVYVESLKAHVLGLSALHWINDALMALFFLLVGLEVKREMLDGQLSTWPRRALPGVAAVGGMMVPAFIYVALNWSTPDKLPGWAIPSSTDIAFALGVLSLLGPRVPVSLKLFLTTLAILDDLGAIAIIALFYTADLSVLMLGVEQRNTARAGEPQLAWGRSVVALSADRRRVVVLHAQIRHTRDTRRCGTCFHHTITAPPDALKHRDVL